MRRVQAKGARTTTSAVHAVCCTRTRVRARSSLGSQLVRVKQLSASAAYRIIVLPLVLVAVGIIVVPLVVVADGIAVGVAVVLVAVGIAMVRRWPVTRENSLLSTWSGCEPATRFGPPGSRPSRSSVRGPSPWRLQRRYDSCVHRRGVAPDR